MEKIKTSVLNMDRLREVSKWEENGPNLGRKTLHEIHAMLPHLLDRIERLEKALSEIASDEVNHTKLNQVRLCCKFQGIASDALESEAN